MMQYYSELVCHCLGGHLCAHFLCKMKPESARFFEMLVNSAHHIVCVTQLETEGETSVVDPEPTTGTSDADLAEPATPAN
jgi:hypothetical protein